MSELTWEEAVSEAQAAIPYTRGKDGTQKIYIAGKMTTPRGINGNATLATSEKGAKLLTAMAADIINFLDVFAKA